MTEQAATTTSRTVAIVVAVIIAVVVLAIVGVIGLGFVLPFLTGADNLVDLFNAVRPGR